MNFYFMASLNVNRQFIPLMSQPEPCVILKILHFKIRHDQVSHVQG